MAKNSESITRKDSMNVVGKNSNKLAEGSARKPVENTPEIINENILQDKIYVIRGQKVMLDYDLAKIYWYTTSAFNQQVARNIEKFDEDFMFQLDNYDLSNLSITRNVMSSTNLISQNVISSWGGTRKMPYAFTEQGIYMLMTVLRGELATKQSKALIRTFKNMKDYIIENQEKIDYKSSLQLAMRVIKNTQDVDKMKVEIDRLDGEMNEINKKLEDTIKKSDISPVLLDFNKVTEQREYVFFDGELMRASELYTDIYGKAKHSVYVIDNVGKRLSMINKYNGGLVSGAMEEVVKRLMGNRELELK